jgi:hypothetical protein
MHLHPCSSVSENESLRGICNLIVFVLRIHDLHVKVAESLFRSNHRITRSEQVVNGMKMSVYSN